MAAAQTIFESFAGNEDVSKMQELVFFIETEKSRAEHLIERPSFDKSSEKIQFDDGVC